ncbi:hypothetical protein DH2020_027339 [Rehmannia glutinosa]|uniref:Uncharacterized protein n=1 Tax=Rehmannia glutinosa TaxID=99300 RepID=A0ABR0VW83_REHGL
MDSSLHGVPLSAAQMPPMAPPSNNTISGIRAPLTVDESDSEYSKSRRNSITSSYYSNSELESDGFVSGGEDDFTETASERYAFHKPPVIKPVGEIVQKNSYSSENGFSRPSVRSPDERAFKGVSDDVNDSDDSRSFLSESGDEFVEDETYVSNRPLVVVKEEENVENGPTPILDIKAPVVQMLHIPIAKISGDSDDDSQGSEVSEVEGFLDIVRVPSFEVLHRINSTPKVRMLEDDEGDDIESQAENMVETEFVEDLVISNGVLGPKDETERIGVVQGVINSVISSDTVQDRGADVNEEAKVSSLVVKEQKYMEFVEDLVISNGVLGPEDEKEHIGVEDTIHTVISSDTVQDRGPDVNEEAKANALVVNEQYNSISESGQNGDLLHLDEEIQEIDVTDDQKKCVDLFDEDIKGNSTGLEDNLVSNQDVESEKLETDSEQEIDQTEDANLTSNDACQSVFKSVKLDRENWREAENSEELPCEVENSTFHTDTNAMVDETERERNSMNLSDGEILLDYAQEIDCRIVTDSDDSAFNPKSVDGAENVSLESNAADLGSTFSSARSIIEARTPEEALSEREKKQLEKTKQIRVKYFRSFSTDWAVLRKIL